MSVNKYLKNMRLKITHNIENLSLNVEQVKEKLASDSFNQGEKEYTVLLQLSNILEKSVKRLLDPK